MNNKINNSSSIVYKAFSMKNRIINVEQFQINHYINILNNNDWKINIPHEEFFDWIIGSEGADAQKS